MTGFKKGDVYEVTVKDILPSGVKVEIVPGQYGLIKKKDFVFSKLIENLHEVVNINDKVKAVIDEIDSSSGLIYLNHNRTKKDPWEGIEKKYSVGQVVEGIVTRVKETAAFVEISEGIEGYIPDDDIFDDRVMLEKIDLWEKDHVRAKITGLSISKKSIKLSIKDVLEKSDKNLVLQNSHNTSTLGDVIGDVLDSLVEKSKTSQNVEWTPGKYSIRTILLVDDEQGILDTLPQMLKSTNRDFKIFKDDLEIITESAIEDAIVKYRENKIDLILTDLYFPQKELDGYDFIEKIRSFNNEQLICVLSGDKYIDYPRLMKYRLAGIMEKPVIEIEVKEALERIKSGNFFQNLKNNPSTRPNESFYDHRGKNSGNFEIQLSRLLESIKSSNNADFVAILKMNPISKNITVEEEIGDIKTRDHFEWNKLKKSPIIDVMHEKQSLYLNYIISRAPEKFVNLSRHIEVDSFIGIPLFSITSDEYGLFLINHKGKTFNEVDYENAKNKAPLMEKLIDYMNLNRALTKESKLISTGQLTAALIHELKNNMQVLSGQVNELKKMIHSILDNKLEIHNPQGKNELAKLTNSLHGKMEESFQVIKNFRNLFDDSRCNYISINMLIDETIQITKHHLEKKRITHHIKKAADIPLVKMYEDRLKHILINIILNAADQLDIFRGYGRFINIQTIYDLDDSRFPFKIRISDNACGIHTALQEKIFDFLFTTKKEGMGLGLFICRSLITSMGGEIEVEKSLMLLGTSFLIKLPDTGKKNGEKGEH